MIRHERPRFAEQPGPGQESVWDYPRPPRVEPVTRRVRVQCDGVVIADSRRAQRVCETSAPPCYYVPPEDVRLDLLTASGRRTACEWKGVASYFDVRTRDRRFADAAWTYPRPTAGYEMLAGWIAFYPHDLECLLDDERARAQDGRFYGGWISRDLVGPFKGGPGSAGW